jgi:hypothetical protein
MVGLTSDHVAAPHHRVPDLDCEDSPATNDRATSPAAAREDVASRLGLSRGGALTCNPWLRLLGGESPVALLVSSHLVLKRGV